MKHPYPLHVHISTLFVVLILLVGSLVGVLGYRSSQGVLERSADALTERASHEVLIELDRALAPARMVVGLLGRDALVEATSLHERLESLERVREALVHAPLLSALYVGYPDGDFFMVRRLVDEQERQLLDAPPGSVYMVQSIDRQHPVAGEYRYLDAHLGVLRVQARPAYPQQFDPRSRMWYQAAREGGQAVQTPPYVFFSNGRIGTTLAGRAAGGSAQGVVIGADILLETLSGVLAGQKMTPGTEIALLDADGLVVAHAGSAPAGGNAGLLPEHPQPQGEGAMLAPAAALGVPVFAQLAAALPDGGDRQALSLSVEGAVWKASIHRLSPNGLPYYLVIAIPERELMADALRMRDLSLLLTLLVICLSVPVAWWLARRVSESLRALAGEAEAIRHFDFEAPIRVRSFVKEVQELALTMDGMKATVRRFLSLNAQVAAERDFERLMQRVLGETLSAASASLGVLYLTDEKGLLNPAMVRQGATEGQIAGQTDTGALRTLQPQHADEAAVVQALGARRAAAIRLSARDAAGVGLDAAQWQGAHAIAVPLNMRDGQQVGAMLLLRNAPLEEALIGFVDAMSGLAAVSLENQQLIKLQRALFDSFVRVIAAAIDAKSAHTGGHCSRVPELARMLAQAACDAGEGPYAAFQLDEQGWEALHLAAWLHDCGKVTTPEYVIDKATKLETLHDRIHEVRMRFEVLKRDARIACLEAIANGADPGQAEARLQAEWQALDDDFAFVASCNQGAERMSDTQRARLQVIARRSWLRTLSDRIGISAEELARKAVSPEPDLPVFEPLLADRPEHCLPRRESERFGPGNPWGFNMRVPEWLYDRGELHCLGVERGTLTDEERYKINEHIVQTEIMLRQLIYPRHLRNVPEIAAGHHEKMDGSGYPKGLTREQMSPLARMMAIADIFEALTASDRPYKRGKKLSEALAIMAGMRDERHVDDELFALFVTSRAYLDYARRFMSPEQIDEVDEAALLRRA